MSLLFVLFFAAAFAGGFTEAEINSMLSAHNADRALYGVEPLTWDYGIADIAQRWAEGCSMGHSGHSGLGENIAMASPAPPSGNWPRYSQWASEKNYWTCSMSNFGGCSQGTYGCLHWTQILSRRSTKLGCGQAVCQGDMGFLVCNYSPEGNFNIQTERPVNTCNIGSVPVSETNPPPPPPTFAPTQAPTEAPTFAPVAQASPLSVTSISTPNNIIPVSGSFRVTVGFTTTQANSRMTVEVLNADRYVYGIGQLDVNPGGGQATVTVYVGYNSLQTGSQMTLRAWIVNSQDIGNWRLASDNAQEKFLSVSVGQQPSNPPPIAPPPVSPPPPIQVGPGFKQCLSDPGNSHLGHRYWWGSYSPFANGQCQNLCGSRGFSVWGHQMGDYYFCLCYASVPSAPRDNDQNCYCPDSGSYCGSYSTVAVYY